MKFVIVFLIIYSPFVHSQKEPQLGWSNSEIFFITTGLDQSEEIHYHAEPLGSRWDADNTSPPSNFDLTSDYGEGWYPDITEPGIGNVSTASTTQYYANTWGFDFINANPIINDYTLAYGVYKISISESERNANFYLDYRDTRFRTYDITQGSGIDVWFIYDGANDKFGYRRYDCPVTVDPEDFIEITNAEYLPIWEIKEQSSSLSPATSDFEDYWENCLILFPSVSNNPRLVWGPYPESVPLSGYQIYRKVGSGLNFIMIHFNNENQFVYIDTDYSITEPIGVQLQYYIRAAWEEEGVSDPTNTVTTAGISILKDHIGRKVNSGEYYLSTNYPNPFNPTTKINYSIQTEGLVSLKVFDILGNEVAFVVNKYQSEGVYEVNFSAAELPSGIYFYRLQAGDFVETKKMILMK
jgi:hypothetical protein